MISRRLTWMYVIFWRAICLPCWNVGTVADRTAYGFVKGYERDYNKFYRDAEVDRLAMGVAGVKRNTGQHPGGIVVIPNYMDVYDLHLFNIRLMM